MIAILLKNYYFYRRNMGEFIMQLVTSLIEITPIYLMMLSKNVSYISCYEILTNYLLALCILNVVVNVSYEYYKEIIKEDAVDFKLAKISRFKYAFCQTIFYSGINMSLFLVVQLLIRQILPIKILLPFNIASFILLLFSTILFFIWVVSLNSFLAIIVEKTKLFSMSSLICNILIVISGCYNPVTEFTGLVKYISYINPLTYFVNFIKYFFCGSDLLMNNVIFFSAFTALTLIYLVTFYILQKKVSNLVE